MNLAKYSIMIYKETFSDVHSKNKYFDTVLDFEATIIEDDWSGVRDAKGLSELHVHAWHRRRNPGEVRSTEDILGGCFLCFVWNVHFPSLQTLHSILQVR